MDIVDELDTPGCPNCAVKHLCSALAHYLDVPRALREQPYSDVDVYLARAAVNLVEAQTGYASHAWFAVGLMERAEEVAAVMHPALIPAIRATRTDYMSGAADISSTVSSLTHLVSAGMPFVAAHLAEARRELPSHEWDCTADAESIAAAIASVRKEYFDIPEPAVGDGSKERSQEMATAKKAACAAGKGGAVKAACKGGKCKGGKCKK